MSDVIIHDTCAQQLNPNGGLGIQVGVGAQADLTRVLLERTQPAREREGPDPRQDRPHRVQPQPNNRATLEVEIDPEWYEDTRRMLGAVPRRVHIVLPLSVTASEYDRMRSKFRSFPGAARLEVTSLQGKQ